MATYVPAMKPPHPTRTGKFRSVDNIVRLTLHTSEGSEGLSSAENLSFFISTPRTPDNLASYHTIADTDRLIQCVPDDHNANAASGGNLDGLHLCIPGRVRQTREEWLDPISRAYIDQAAEWLIDKGLRYNIPMTKLTIAEVRDKRSRGYCGHNDVSKAFGLSTHTDPEPNFPWDVLAQSIQAKTTPIVDPGFPPFDPARGEYALYPLAAKLHTWEGGQGDSIAYAQGVLKNVVAHQAHHFLVNGYADVDGTPGRAMFFTACRDTASALTVDGAFNAATASAVEFMQRAFRWSSYDGQAWGDLPAPGIGFGEIDQATWAFIDAQSDRVYVG